MASVAAAPTFPELEGAHGGAVAAAVALAAAAGPPPSPPARELPQPIALSPSPLRSELPSEMSPARSELHSDPIARRDVLRGGEAPAISPMPSPLSPVLSSPMSSTQSVARQESLRALPPPLPDLGVAARAEDGSVPATSSTARPRWDAAAATSALQPAAAALPRWSPDLDAFDRYRGISEEHDSQAHSLQAQLRALERKRWDREMGELEARVAARRGQVVAAEEASEGRAAWRHEEEASLSSRRRQAAEEQERRAVAEMGRARHEAARHAGCALRAQEAIQRLRVLANQELIRTERLRGSSLGQQARCLQLERSLEQKQGEVRAMHARAEHVQGHVAWRQQEVAQDRKFWAQRRRTLEKALEDAQFIALEEQNLLHSRRRDLQNRNERMARNLRAQLEKQEATFLARLDDQLRTGMSAVDRGSGSVGGSEGRSRSQGRVRRMTESSRACGGGAAAAAAASSTAAPAPVGANFGIGGSTGSSNSLSHPASARHRRASSPAGIGNGGGDKVAGNGGGDKVAALRTHFHRQRTEQSRVINDMRIEVFQLRQLLEVEDSARRAPGSVAACAFGRAGWMLPQTLEECEAAEESLRRNRARGEEQDALLFEVERRLDERPALLQQRLAAIGSVSFGGDAFCPLSATEEALLAAAGCADAEGSKEVSRLTASSGLFLLDAALDARLVAVRTADREARLRAEAQGRRAQRTLCEEVSSSRSKEEQAACYLAAEDANLRGLEASCRTTAEAAGSEDEASEAEEEKEAPAQSRCREGSAGRLCVRALEQAQERLQDALQRRLASELEALNLEAQQAESRHARLREALVHEQAQAERAQERLQAEESQQQRQLLEEFGWSRSPGSTTSLHCDDRSDGGGTAAAGGRGRGGRRPSLTGGHSRDTQASTGRRLRCIEAPPPPAANRSAGASLGLGLGLGAAVQPKASPRAGTSSSSSPVSARCEVLRQHTASPGAFGAPVSSNSARGEGTLQHGSSPRISSNWAHGGGSRQNAGSPGSSDAAASSNLAWRPNPLTSTTSPPSSAREDGSRQQVSPSSPLGPRGTSPALPTSPRSSQSGTPTSGGWKGGRSASAPRILGFGGGAGSPAFSSAAGAGRSVAIPLLQTSRRAFGSSSARGLL